MAVGIYRTLEPGKQRAWLSAMERLRDGQSAEDAFLETLIELGDDPDEARWKIQEALADTSDWRTALN